MSAVPTSRSFAASGTGRRSDVKGRSLVPSSAGMPTAVADVIASPARCGRVTSSSSGESAKPTGTTKPATMAARSRTRNLLRTNSISRTLSTRPGIVHHAGASNTRKREARRADRCTRAHWHFKGYATGGDGGETADLAKERLFRSYEVPAKGTTFHKL